MQAVQAGVQLLGTCLSAGQLSSSQRLHRALCLLTRMRTSVEAEQMSRYTGIQSKRPHLCTSLHVFVTHCMMAPEHAMQLPAYAWLCEHTVCSDQNPSSSPTLLMDC